MGRIRAAIAVLLGRQQTYPQIAAEWAEMKADWLSAFDKLNALVARMAKERKRLTEAIAESHGVEDGQPEQPQQAESPAERKAALRRRVFGIPGGGSPAPRQNGPQNGSQSVPAPDGVGEYVPADQEAEG